MLISPRVPFIFSSCTVLIGPRDDPENVDQEDYLCQLKEVLNPGEYHTLRTDWLNYQKCSLNVDGMYKRIKLLLRGSRFVSKRVSEYHSVISSLVLTGL